MRPRCPIWKLGRPEMTAPSKTIEPIRHFSAPATRLTSVVLPAPFGPMRAVIDPRLTEKGHPTTALSPPKAGVTRSISRMVSGVGDPLAAARRERPLPSPPPRGQPPLGPEPRGPEHHSADR